MKILIVLTSHEVLGNTGRRTGLWLEEGAAPYFVFRNAGVDLTLASPKGGLPPIDPKSDLPENQMAARAWFKQNAAAQKDLAVANWKPHAIIDGRLVTGKNPASSTAEVAHQAA